MQKVPDTIVEKVLTELSAATADLVKSANIAVSRMVLRSKLSTAISDAGKAERAAEELRAVASIVPRYEQADLFSELPGSYDAAGEGLKPTQVLVPQQSPLT